MRYEMAIFLDALPLYTSLESAAIACLPFINQVSIDEDLCISLFKFKV